MASHVGACALPKHCQGVLLHVWEGDMAQGDDHCRSCARAPPCLRHITRKCRIPPPPVHPPADAISSHCTLPSIIWLHLLLNRDT